MKIKVIQNNTVFFSIIVIYWIFLGIMLFIYGYKDSFLIINGLNLPALDYPMFLLTHLGDALILTSVLALFLSQKNPALVLYIIIIALITGLTGQLLKNFVFEDCHRPLKVFEGMNVVHTVAGYKMYHNSFPSGHSIVAAVAITAAVSVLKLNSFQKVIAALSLIVISYTRTYIGVHFPGDVLAGTIIGVAGALLFLNLLYIPLQNWTIGLNVAKRKKLFYFLISLAIVSIITGIYLIFDFVN
ncbi:MAG: phosphatase PAP2 family protein [Lentimicrobium sp.]|nr:phosphatase PAP2 family protein [Lentimicrobium sp.]